LKRFIIRDVLILKAKGVPFSRVIYYKLILLETKVWNVCYKWGDHKMPRKARLFLNNAIYHAMARGNQKQLTFINEEDFVKYLDILKHYKRKYKFKLYGYCLMPNHVHLMLEVEHGPDLGKIMQGLNQTYTIWFNHKYKKVGHLWQGRYKSKVVQKDGYLWDCIEYMETNPIRANISKSPFEYYWSSWKMRLGYQTDSLLDIPVL